jgi:steroid delta-isomerase-like uncharacterized protein
MRDNKRIVTDYLDRVWNQYDYTAIDEYIRPDYIQHSPHVPPGREGVRAFFKMMESAFSEVTFMVEDMIAEGEKVVWRWTIQGKHTGTFRGLPATNKNFSFSGISILRLVDGKFAEIWVEQDMAGLLQKLQG